MNHSQASLSTKNIDKELQHKIENDFKTKLLHQLTAQKPVLNFEQEGPLFPIEHPKVVWSKILHHYDLLDFSDQAITQKEINIYHYQENGEAYESSVYFSHYFKDLHEAENILGTRETPVFSGHPFAVYDFMRQRPKDALFHFKDYGIWYLSVEKDMFLRTSSSHMQNTQKTTNALQQYLASLIQNYLFSEELWSKTPSGKWMRIHDNVLHLLRQYHLLGSSFRLGYYELTSKASSLEKYGLQFTKIDSGYLMIPSWSFSLSDLDHLKNICSKEFSCSS